MDEINTSFKNYVDAYKQLPIADKRQEIIRAINEIVVLFDTLAKNSNIELSYLKNSEIQDLNNGKESEDDYLEALLVYIENAKSMIGEYLIKKDQI